MFKPISMSIHVHLFCCVQPRSHHDVTYQTDASIVITDKKGMHIIKSGTLNYFLKQDFYLASNYFLRKVKLLESRMFDTCVN